MRAASCPTRSNDTARRGAGGILARLARDTGGNVIAIVAGAMVPLLALVGGGIDLGRTYLIQSRLQQACDAGVLGARKQMGGIANFSIATDGLKIATRGDSLFKANLAAASMTARGAASALRCRTTSRSRARRA